MSYKIAVCIPYFVQGGALPGYFPAWHKSVLNNSDIDFYFFTDSDDVKSDKNFFVIRTTFKDYVEKISNKLGFKVACSTPYKLCDYKPVIGYVFQDVLSEYDYWGYCDVDLVFGQIREFLTDEILGSNDRILLYGHFSLFRNCERINKLFMSNGEYPEYNYEEAFLSEDPCYFDEFYGMLLKCYRNNISIWKSGCFRDCNPAKSKFFEGNNKQIIAHWSNGRLEALREDGTAEVLLYFHFQKRKMTINDEGFYNCNDFYIVPGGFVCKNSNAVSDLFDFNQGGVWYGYFFILKKTLRALKKYGITGVQMREKRRKEVLSLMKKYTAI